MDFKVETISLNLGELKQVIREIDDAIDRHQRLKALCEQIVQLQQGGKVSSSAPSPVRGARRGRRRGGKKPLREYIVEVLAASSEPMGGSALRDAVTDAGYKTRGTDKSFYTAVYNAAKNEPRIVKIGKAFALGEGGAPKSTKKKRGRPRKKPGRPRKKPGRPRKSVSA